MRRGTCRFFNGVQHDKCNAGIEYKGFRGIGSGKLPCITQYSEPDVECDKYTEPSKEEVAASDRRIEAAVNRMTKLTPLISRVKSEHKGHSWSGTEACPICSGKLHLSHAAFNGHVWGRCETGNCVRWAE